MTTEEDAVSYKTTRLSDISFGRIHLFVRPTVLGSYDQTHMVSMRSPDIYM